MNGGGAESEDSVKGELVVPTVKETNDDLKEKNYKSESNDMGGNDNEQNKERQIKKSDAFIQNLESIPSSSSDLKHHGEISKGESCHSKNTENKDCHNEENSFLVDLEKLHKDAQNTDDLDLEDLEEQMIRLQSMMVDALPQSTELLSTKLDPTTKSLFWQSYEANVIEPFLEKVSKAGNKKMWKEIESLLNKIKALKNGEQSVQDEDEDEETDIQHEKALQNGQQLVQQNLLNNVEEETEVNPDKVFVNVLLNQVSQTRHSKLPSSHNVYPDESGNIKIDHQAERNTTLLHAIENNKTEKIAKVLSCDNIIVEDRVAALAATKGFNLVVEHYMGKNNYADKINKMISKTPEEKATLLFNAVVSGRKELAKFLLKNGASVSILLENGERLNLIHSLGREEEWDMFNLLLDYCENPEKLTGYIYMENAIEMIDKLLDDDTLVDSKMKDVAIERGHLMVVLKFIEQKTPPQEELDKMVRDCCIHGSLEIIQLVLFHGGNLVSFDEKGTSGLHIACKEGQVLCVQEMLDLGVSIELQVRIPAGMRPLHVAAMFNQRSVVELLLNNGAKINQVDNIGQTAINWATQEGDEEIISLLLERGGDPKIHSHSNLSPLFTALRGRHCSTALLLLSHSRIDQNMGSILALNICEPGMEDFVVPFLNQLKKEVHDFFYVMTLKTMLSTASQKGLTKIVALLMEEAVGSDVFKDSVIQKCFGDVPSIALENLIHTVKSDNPDSVKTICNYVKTSVPQDVVDCALERGSNSIIDILKLMPGGSNLNGKGTDEGREKFEKMKIKLENGDLSGLKIIQRIPKSVEWDYNDFFDGFDNYLDENNQITLDKLVNVLKAAPIHFDNCNSSCKAEDQMICQMLRESSAIQRDLLSKIASIFPVFEESHSWPVGSITERTRLGYNDEMDTQCALDLNFSSLLEFDNKTQTVRARHATAVDKNHKIQPYIMPGGEFNVTKLAEDFLLGLVLVLENYEIPEECHVSRNHLEINTNFVPCDECVDLSRNVPIWLRCCHNKECSVTVTWSKADGAYSVVLTETHLSKEKPVGWVDELAKQTRTGAALNNDSEEGGLSLCRLKRINLDTVCAVNSKPFMTKGTLAGTRRTLYILLKILRKLTDSSVKNYQMKVAVATVFKHIYPVKGKIGEAVLEMMRHQHIRGQFRGLHQGLRAKGFRELDLSHLSQGFVTFVR
eukprot:GFUD01036311.1.p1 GENE.GFUD01036311.1~~GFUD01036311.1.p1  ORF type:complete len:1191 (+),score=243.44 GFUD01036311.1:19-3591(+)